MGFAVELRFVHGAFEATSFDDPGAAEWPPHPARLFAAFVAVADTDVDLETLRWLEALAPPSVAVPPVSIPSRPRRQFVVTNVAEKQRAYFEHLGRAARGQRCWPRAFVGDRVVRFVWDADPGVHHDRLDRLCQRIPYLGRSSSPVVARVVAPAPGASDTMPVAASASAHEVLRPDEHGGLDVSVPYPGYLDALRSVFDAGELPWTAPRQWRSYSAAGTTRRRHPAVPSRHRPLIVFRVARGAHPPATATVRYATALRAALVRTLDPGPASLHGHGDRQSGYDQVSVLALPYVGLRDVESWAHADGHLVGFALAIPRRVPDDEYRQILRGALAVDELYGPDLPKVGLDRSVDPGIATLRPSRWTAASTRWVSALPVVLDRTPRGDGAVEDIVRRACRWAGLPDPATVEVSRTPLLVGTPPFRPNQLVRRRGDRVLPHVYVAVEFDTPVEGPVVLGNLRHLGLGLCLPDLRERRPSAEGGRGADVNGGGEGEP